jgi:hypothetical protein
MEESILEIGRISNIIMEEQAKALKELEIYEVHDTYRYDPIRKAGIDARLILLVDIIKQINSPKKGDGE